MRQGETSGLRARMVDHIHDLAALSEDESYGAHRVFAGLYVRTNRHLLAWFDTLDDPTFCRLAMIRFYELYEERVVRPVRSGAGVTSPHWKDYETLAARLGMGSAVNDLARLMVRGARAHVRYDLAEAIRLAVRDFRRIRGHDPELEAGRAALLGRASGAAFFAASLEFNAFHRERVRGRRRAMLAAHARLAIATRPIWIGVLQSWRRAAWRDALTELAREARASSAIAGAPVPRPGGLLARPGN